jgi:hypothetical protein
LIRIESDPIRKHENPIMFRDLAVFARNGSKLLAIVLGGRRNYNLSKK